MLVKDVRDSEKYTCVIGQGMMELTEFLCDYFSLGSWKQKANSAYKN